MLESPTPPGPPAGIDADAGGRSRAASVGGRYFRRGLGLRQEVKEGVAAEYRSDWVGRLREAGGTLEVGDLTLRLAAEVGFCYGVERAVDYAYETLRRFPDRRIVLTGEIIHNPDVNERLRSHGIRFLGEAEVPDVSSIGVEDVVVIPAFGVTASLFESLRRSGAVVVDTTCGSVLNVWKNVERYAREGRTSIVHGKAAHEETRATVSRTLLAQGAHYLVLLDLAEAELVAGYIRAPGADGAPTREELLERFRGRSSAGFDPDEHLARIGMANQTTMLSRESLAIAELLRSAVLERYGPNEAGERFRAFDTICSATQDRQDALRSLIEEPLDLMLVIGGYNSSNTGHLLEIAAAEVRAYHIDGPSCLVSREVIRHKAQHTPGETETRIEGGWLPAGPLRIGLTAGASTPDVVIGAVVERVLALRGG